MDTAVEELTEFLKHNPRTFASIRRFTTLKLTNRGFYEFMNSHADTFVPVTLMDRDRNGVQVIPGNAGMGLKRASEL